MTSAKQKTSTSTRRKERYARYKSDHIREKHKVVRVVKSSGVKAAFDYAHKHGITEWTKTKLTSLGYSLV